VFGVSSYKEIKNRYSMSGKQSIEAKNESELHAMTFFTDQDIEKAKEDIEIMLQNNLLPSIKEVNQLMNKKPLPLKFK
jgi:hypothetical protein